MVNEDEFFKTERTDPDSARFNDDILNDANFFKTV